MATTSSKLCTTAANDARWGGTLGNWSNTANATVESDAAVASQDTDNTEGAKGNFLYLSNPGFTSSDVPDNAKVDVFRFYVRRKTEANTGNTNDDQVRLVGPDGNPIGPNKAAVANWSTSFETVTYEWTYAEVGLSYADIRDTQYGIMISTTASTSTNKLAQVAYAKAECDYTANAHPTYVEAYPATAANTASIGDDAWTNPSNATGAPDATYATGNFDGDVDQSQLLTLTNCSLAIPTGATIDGIMTFWLGRSTSQASGGNPIDLANRVIKGGSVVATDKSKGSGVSWLESQTTGQGDEWRVYGSPTDLWGETWTESDIEASNFGAGAAVQTTSTTNLTFQMGACLVRVYYTEASGDIALNGSITGASSVSGSLGLDRPVAGTITNAGAVAGTLTKDQPVTGTVSGASAVSGNVGINYPVSADIEAESAIAGTLTRTFSVSAGISAIAELLGDLAANLGGASSVSNASDVSGALGVDMGLESEISNTVNISGTLMIQSGEGHAPGILGDSNLCDLPP